MSTQLYAKIKRTSKYEHQNQVAKEGPHGFPFPVTVDAGWFDSYCVRGGPGGGYRLTDVNLFVIADGKELRIS
jgi:hypothetical protein